MVWTEERRAKQAATVAAKRGGTAVAESELMAPDGTAAMPSSTEMFMARMRGTGPVTTSEAAPLAENDAQTLDLEGASVEHASGGLIWLYKQEPWGWHRRRFPKNSIIDLVQSGMRDACGDCGSNRCPGTINGCSAGRKYKYVECPVANCNDGNPKRFYDLGDTLQTQAPLATDDDLLAIRNVYGEITPEKRIRAQLDAHLRAYHEQTAMGLGLITTSQTVAN